MVTECMELDGLYKTEYNMKILKRKEPTVKRYCPHCGSLLELEKGDIRWYRDISGTSSPYVKCAACGKDFDVNGWPGITKIY